MVSQHAAGVWLTATETELSADRWALVEGKGRLGKDFTFFQANELVHSMPQAIRRHHNLPLSRVCLCVLSSSAVGLLIDGLVHCMRAMEYTYSYYLLLLVFHHPSLLHSGLKNLTFLQIHPTAAFLPSSGLINHMDSPDCLLILLSRSVFTFFSFSVLHFLVVGFVR